MLCDLFILKVMVQHCPFTIETSGSTFFYLELSPHSIRGCETSFVMPPLKKATLKIRLYIQQVFSLMSF